MLPLKSHFQTRHRDRMWLLFTITLTLHIISLPIRPAVAEGPYDLSSWDAEMSSIQLENVSIEAKSIVIAWRRLSTYYLLRTILYLSVENGREPTSFSYSAQHCTAADVFNAFVATYPDMTWTPDPQTGVIWFHPHSVPYSKILARKVRLDSDMLGVPMQTGVLEPIGKLHPFVLRVATWGTIFTSAFNYTVNVPAGTYTVRDLLNKCCKTQMANTFYIRTYYRSSKSVESIMALTLYPEFDIEDSLDFPRAGARLWLKTNLGLSNVSPPQRTEIINNFCSRDIVIRFAARAYFAAEMHHYDIEKWISESKGTDRALWVCLAGTDIFVTSEYTTLTAAIKRMKKEASNEFLMTGDPGLALLTALELGRVAHDTHYLDILSRRNFAPGELSGVVENAYRICRQSPEVREKLSDMGMDWLVAAEPKLAGLADAQPKCEFKLVNATVPK